MDDREPKISVLVSARKNSKFLSKFLFGYFSQTNNFRDTEIIVMHSEQDTWNAELIWFFWDKFGVIFHSEDYGLGRAGLHHYLNDLIDWSRGDWLAYFCEDHFIIKPDWDKRVREFIKKHELDPSDIWCIVAKFDNVGAMNHILSRGYVDAMGGVLGRHGWIDSYINDVFEKFPDRLLRMDDELFHDFSHDHPNPMDEAHLQSVITDQGKKLPKYKSPEVEELVKADQDKISKVLEAERELQR